MEFMLSEALPIYSGGLGNVAAINLKPNEKREALDASLSLAATKTIVFVYSLTLAGTVTLCVTGPCPIGS